MPGNRSIALTIANFKVALGIAQTAADLSNVPAVQVVFGAASTLLDIIETTQANKDDCESIAASAIEIVTAIAKSLSGKDEKTLDADLRGQIEKLGSKLLEISGKLAKMADRGRLRRVWTSKVDSKDIQGFKDDLASAMQVFQVQFNINQGLLGAARHDEVMEEFKKISITVQTPKESFVYSAPPAPPAIFYGRDDYVANAVLIILTKAPTRLAILGPGGMGKTSVAITILHDLKIKDHFGQVRYFAPCDSASTASMLLNILMKVVGIQNPKEDPLRCLLGFLHSAGQLLLVLDNFETPWEGDSREEVEVILSHFASIDTLTLLITMRGTVYPMGPKWTKPGLQPLSALDENAARLSYLDICSISDHSLDLLLKELDYIPLAITLTAKVAESDDLSPSDMLTKWKTHHTTLLRVGGNSRLSNLDVSISLSIANHMVQKEPETLQLLALVCALPDGVFKHLWPQIGLFFQNGDQAAQTLRQASLAYKDHSHELRVLSPIRYHVQMNHKMSETLYDQLRKLYFTFASLGSDYQSMDKDIAGLLMQESGNITSILYARSTAGNTEELIYAVAAYSVFLYFTYPSCELLQHTLQQEKDNMSSLSKGTLLYRLGEMQRVLSQFDEATIQLHAAKLQFESIGDMQGIVNCQKSLGDVALLLGQYDEAITQLESAKLGFTSLDNNLGAIECQQSLGNIARMCGRNHEATTLLQQAKIEFESIGNKLGAAQCQKSLGSIAFALSQFAQATTEFQGAKLQFELIGDKHGAAQCQQNLGNIASRLDQYDLAIAQLREAKIQFENIGRRHGAAKCQHSLGNIAYMLSQYDEAITELQAAKLEFESLGDRLSAAQCQRGLGNIARSLRNFDEAAALLQTAKLEFESLGNKLEVAQCELGLGDIAACLSQYDEATVQLQAAKQQFENLGEMLGVAQSQRSLGNIASILGQYEEATTQLQEAELLFQGLQDMSGMAQCQLSLGRLAAKLSLHDLARAQLQMAKLQFDSIGNLNGAAMCQEAIDELVLDGNDL